MSAQVLELAEPKASPIIALVSFAFRLLHERFENIYSPQRLFYHTTNHSRRVIINATKIGRAIGLPEHDLLLVQIAAAYHDVVQNWGVVEKENDIRIRKRHVGLNENSSAQEALEQMQASKIHFTQCDMDLVSEAIRATTPGWSQKHLTVIQPFLTDDSSDVARAVALADIGSAGMDSCQFSREGFQLFMEEQLDVSQALLRSKVSDMIPAEKQASYQERLIAWLKVQVTFAQGRKACFQEELGPIGKQAENAVTALFSHFDESIERAHQTATDAESMEFRELMWHLHPGAFPCEWE